MSFLSLARGDREARDLLQRAIRARYGQRPIAIESVRLSMTARSKGPFGLPAQQTVTAAYVAEGRWRWDQSTKLFGFSLGQSEVAFINDHYYERAKNISHQKDSPETVQAVRRRLWSELAFFLTPLTVLGVTVTTVDDHTFRAVRDLQPSDSATILLGEGDTVSVQTEAYRPTPGRVEPLTISSQGELQMFEGFIVPKRIVYRWGDASAEVFTVIKAEANPTIPVTDFILSVP
ncbi:MAG: hypothetical protein ABI947_08380 [Chloroflexota bacterium]